MSPRKSNAARVAAEPEMVWKGAEELRPMLVLVSDLREDPRNARLHPERSIAAIAESFDRHGQRKPGVARPDGTMVAGSGMLRAVAERLGWTHVAVTRYDADAATLGNYSLYDNRSAELSLWAPDELAQQLQELAKGDIAALGALWNPDELMGALAALPSPDASDLPGLGARGGRPAAELAGGAEGVLANDPTNGGLTPANVVMVQLFLTPEQEKVFREHVRVLATRYCTTTTSETVIEAVRLAAASSDEPTA